MSDERALHVGDGVGGEGFIAVPVNMLGRLSPNAFALWVALLKHGWRDGRAWPGMAKLTELTTLGEKGLRAAKRELLDAGLLTERRRGRGLTNLYRVYLQPQVQVENRPTAGSRTVPGQDAEPSQGRHEVDEVEVDDSLRSSTEADAPPTTSEQQGNGPTPPVPLAPPPSELTEREQRQDVIDVCHALANRMRANDPKAKVSPDSKLWRTAARLLLDRDERPLAEILAVIDWCQSDDFERANVLSVPKLRKRYGALLLKMQRDRRAPSSPRNAPHNGSSTSELAAWINRPAGTSRADLDRRTGVH